MSLAVKQGESYFEVCRMVAMIIAILDHITSLGHTIDSISIIYGDLFQFEKVACMSTLYYCLISLLFVVAVLIVGILFEIIRKRIENLAFTNTKIDSAITFV